MSEEGKYILLAMLVSSLTPAVAAQVASGSLAPVGAVLALLGFGLLSFTACLLCMMLWMYQCDIVFLSKDIFDEPKIPQS